MSKQEKPEAQKNGGKALKKRKRKKRHENEVTRKNGRMGEKKFQMFAPT